MFLVFVSLGDLTLFSGDMTKISGNLTQVSGKMTLGQLDLSPLEYMLWFIIIHYNTRKQKKIKFEPRTKLNQNIYSARVQNVVDLN